MPGTWTAVFFTVKNGGGNFGTSGTIKWQADTWAAGTAGKIAPGSLTIAPGATKTAMFTAKSPHAPGDAAQSIVLADSDGTTTVPVTVRTLVKTGHGARAGTFNGVLTGGNGRGNPAVMSTYSFDVRKRPARHRRERGAVRPERRGRGLPHRSRGTGGRLLVESHARQHGLERDPHRHGGRLQGQSRAGPLDVRTRLAPAQSRARASASCRSRSPGGSSSTRCTPARTFRTAGRSSRRARATRSTSRSRTPLSHLRRSSSTRGRRA